MRSLQQPARWWSALWCLTLLVASAGSVLAQNDDAKSDLTEQKPVYPVLSVNVASVDHLFDRMNLIFSLIERPELADFVGAKLADFRDLKGLDRKRPAGVMVILDEAGFLTPIPIAYIPVEDMGELKQTASTIGVQINEVPNETDRYEFIPRRGGTQQMVVRGGYAFITQQAANLEFNFADPAQAQAALSNRYDLSLSVNITRLPDAARNLLVTTIRSTTQASIQQRDDEPDGAYEFRRLQAEGNLKFIEDLLKEGEEATLGLKVDRATVTGALELVIKAKGDTAFAKELSEGIGKPSYFQAALSGDTPLSVSLSSTISAQQIKQTREIFRLGEREVNRGIAKLPKEATEEEIPKLESLQTMFDSLRATIDNGHLDGFVQFFGDPKSKFVLIGGVKLSNATGFGAGLSDILARAKEATTDIEVELSAASHGEAVFHRVTGKNVGAPEKMLYGENVSALIGTDQEALWFCLGGDTALPTLKDAMDRVTASRANPPAPASSSTVPFEFVMHLNHWIGLRAQDQENLPPPARLAKEAFAQANSDTLRIDIRPIENGFRMRAELQNGFLRLLGLAIARGIDGNSGL